MYEYSFQEKSADGSWSTLMQHDSLEEIQASLPEWCKEFFDENGFWPVYGRHYKVTYDVPSRQVLVGMEMPQDSDREARAC